MMDIFLLSLALLGHAFLWIGLTNRLHAIGIRRRIIKRITLVFALCAITIPIGVGWWCLMNSTRPAMALWRFPPDGSWPSAVILVYLALCWAMAPVTLFRAAWFRALRPAPSVLRFYRRRLLKINPAPAAVDPGESAHHWLCRLPRNEILQVELNEWIIDLPRLPPALDGLSIVQLSDLHLTGRVGKAYFREVVRLCNELRPDLVCITGDIIDRADCFDWIADTLGQLPGRYGSYFILGNHDHCIDLGRLRRTLQQSGLTDLGGRWMTVEINGSPVLLAGNERPWLASAAELSSAPPPAPTGPVRIALAHTPDQFGWGRANDIDLLLAGHTHGGQICIPPLGAIMSPTWKGVKHAWGVFYAPPTVLHVSRGISGDIPIRWNCRPEVALLRLYADKRITR